jgi:hypothetical protein
MHVPSVPAFGIPTLQETAFKISDMGYADFAGHASHLSDQF